MSVRVLQFIALPALFSVLGLLLASCSGADEFNDGICTEIGCGSTFSVSFKHPGVWKAGKYTVDVKLVDGNGHVDQSMCTAELPFTSCNPAPCSLPDPLVLELSGCALPDPNQQSIGGIELLPGFAFASIEVKVSLDGSPIAEDTFTPTYTISRPNGEKCEPECMSAPSATLQVP